MDWNTRMAMVVEDLAGELGVEPPFTAADLFSRVERQWSLPVRMEPFTSTAIGLDEHATGGCRFDGRTLVLQYYAGGSWVQQERIKYHELGHVLFGTVQMGGTRRQACRGTVRSEEELLAEAFGAQMAYFALYGRTVRSHETTNSAEDADGPLQHWYRRLES